MTGCHEICEPCSSSNFRLTELYIVQWLHLMFCRSWERRFRVQVWGQRLSGVAVSRWKASFQHSDQKKCKWFSLWLAQSEEALYHWKPRSKKYFLKFAIPSISLRISSIISHISADIYQRNLLHFQHQIQLVRTDVAWYYIINILSQKASSAWVVKLVEVQGTRSSNSVSHAFMLIEASSHAC